MRSSLPPIPSEPLYNLTNIRLESQQWLESPEDQERHAVLQNPFYERIFKQAAPPGVPHEPSFPNVLALQRPEASWRAILVTQPRIIVARPRVLQSHPELSALPSQRPPPSLRNYEDLTISYDGIEDYGRVETGSKVICGLTLALIERQTSEVGRIDGRYRRKVAIAGADKWEKVECAWEVSGLVGGGHALMRG